MKLVKCIRAMYYNDTDLLDIIDLPYCGFTREYRRKAFESSYWSARAIRVEYCRAATWIRTQDDGVLAPFLD